MTDKKELTAFEQHVIENKGTEAPFSGLYVHSDAPGTYVCKKCQTPLYRSTHKFQSQCGWPSFDDEISGAIQRTPDRDGKRTEITCKSCHAHLGHVFEGERLTDKNIRHCVNSVSLEFKSEMTQKSERAILASGCFWGTEYFLGRLPGVLKTAVGYIGGHIDNPSYEQVCSKKTGHYEAVEVIFDPSKVSYSTLLKLFFETHDFSQSDGQGPDIGPQYRSAIFALNDLQKQTAAALIKELEVMSYQVATEIKDAKTFWTAEDYHQNYYERKGDSPYCHRYRIIFPK